MTENRSPSVRPRLLSLDPIKDWNATIIEQRMVQHLHLDGETGRDRAGRDMVLRIERYAIRVTHGGYAQFHPFGNLVEAGIAFEGGGPRPLF